MGRSIRTVVVVALVDAVILAAALGLAVTRVGDDSQPEGNGVVVGVDQAGGAAPGGTAPPAATPDPALVQVPGGTSGIPARRSAGRGEVAGRPWPSRVAAPGPWSATLAGKGDRAGFTTAGTVVGGVGRTSFDLNAKDPRPAPKREPPASNSALVLPGGARWYPLGPVRLEGPGDVAFSSARIEGSKVRVTVPSLEALVAGGGATGMGTFVQRQGAQVDRLALPAGTRTVAETCPDPTAPSPPPCTDQPPAPLGVEVTATSGQVIRASGDGEVAVAGSARATALGRTWEGLVAAIEARQLRASASYGGDLWTVTAEGPAARQVWVDVWPVVDTKLSATSVLSERSGFFDALRGDTYSLRIQWTNVGFATSQIFEAEGVGPGAAEVAFDLNKTQGHDAGVGVTRGDRVVNMRGGADIDSNLAPGERVDRGLSSTAGASPTVILRGNFPEVRVPLAVPRT